jgi:flagellar hook-associated protein 3 FlgL
MLSNNFLNDMQNNLENLRNLQSQMTSGKEIRKPSDDPFKVARAMQLNTDINTNKQYNENIKDTSSWLDTTDTALNQVGDVLQRVRELLVSTGNAALGTDERGAIKNEINEKVGELSQILNTSFDGKYIFGGTRGTARPVATQVNTAGNNDLLYADRLGNADPSAADATMINSRLTAQISQGVTMTYNVTAGDVIGFTDSSGNAKDLMSIFTNITSHLDGNDTTGTPDPTAVSTLSGQDLTDITDAINNVLKTRSEVGAKSNRMDSALSKNTDENSSMTDLLSKTEDIDITEKTMEYATMQTVYMASLQTSAKVIQPTLMDYLR